MREEGRICVVCDRKFYMWLYQKNRVDPLYELKEEVDSQMNTYQMRVQEAKTKTKELSQMAEESDKIMQESA